MSGCWRRTPTVLEFLEAHGRAAGVHFSVGEVIVDQRWTGDVLSVEDLEGKIIGFDLSSI
jgi:hypothetical protein